MALNEDDVRMFLKVFGPNKCHFMQCKNFAAALANIAESAVGIDSATGMCGECNRFIRIGDVGGQIMVAVGAETPCPVLNG